jgi:hypothetical protein
VVTLRPVRPHWWLRVGALALALLLTSGCLFTDQTAAGRRLHNAPKLLRRSPSVAITVQFRSYLVRQGTLATRPQPDPGLTLTGVMDPRTGRAYYAASGSTKPAVVFDGNTLYASIPTAKPEDARPWISTTTSKKLTDYTLDPSAVPGSLAAFALRPALLVDLLSGALSGSIHRVGSATIGGVATTEYKAKFDIDQALLNATRITYSQKQQDNLTKLFKVLGIKSGDLDPGLAWIDGQGNPRQLAVAITESPVDQSKIVLVVQMQLTPQSTPATLAVPSPNSVETVPSLNQYLLPLKARLGETA